MNTASPGWICLWSTAWRASSSLSKGRAFRVAWNISLGQAVCLITAPSGARLPFRMAMAPSVPMALSKGWMMSCQVVPHLAQ